MIRRASSLLVVAVALACGGKPPPRPAKPKAPDPKLVAAQLDRDMIELGELAGRLRDKCPELIAEMRPLVAKMKLHAEDAKTLQADPELGKQFKAEVITYDERARGRTEKIGENLGAAYLACGKGEPCTVQVQPCGGEPCPEPVKVCPPSKHAEELRKVIDQIPTF